MHRFYLPSAKPQDSEFEISGGEAHHAVTVLRLVEGDEATVLNGEGVVFRCEVRGCDKKRLFLRVISKVNAEARPCEITLVQAIPKGRILEDIIQKATELGVARIVPLLSERTVTRVEAGDQSRKAEKWQIVAVEAIKQSGNPWLPKVEEPVTPAQWLSRGRAVDLALVGSLYPGSRHPRHYFELYRRDHAPKPNSVSMWVGPEGDFSPAEIELIQRAGALPISLGPLVLRVETAAVSCLAIINYELNDPGEARVGQVQ